MSKKSKKSVAPAAQGESFFEGQPVVAAQPVAPAAEGVKAKRTYKPRAKAAGAVKSAGKVAVQAAWQAGFKAGIAFSEMGA